MASKPLERFLQLGKAPALLKRRVFCMLGLGALLNAPLCPAAQGLAKSQESIQQPRIPSDKAFIQRAFEMRRLAIQYGDQAYGAVVVRDKRIIGQSWSRVILDSDPTGHAEMSAIRDAALRLNGQGLQGAMLYSSSPPCPMCEAAARWCDIDEIFSGKHASRVRARQCQ